MSIEADQHGEPESEDPRDRDRQVADIVAAMCMRRRVGETAGSALRSALLGSSSPVSVALLEAVDESCAEDAHWSATCMVLHQLARRWRSPMLATLADAYSDGGHALNLDYLSAVATSTGIEHAAPSPLALKRLKHPRHGLGWDEAEDQRLLAAFRRGATIEALSSEHQRNANAIRARLLKHGVIEDDRPGQPESSTG